MATTKKKKTRAKKEVNKSKAIRDCKDKTPSMKPKAIAESLSKKGIKVSPAFVSTVLSNSKKSKTKRRSAGGRPSRGSSIAVNDLVLAKKLAREMGGIDRAQTALSALALLQ